MKHIRTLGKKKNRNENGNKENMSDFQNEENIIVSHKMTLKFILINCFSLLA